MSSVIQRGNLADWLKSVQPALTRLGGEAFPPRLPDDLLTRFDLSDIVDPIPLGKQAEMIRALRWMLENREPAIVLAKQGSGKTLMALYALRGEILSARAQNTRYRVLVVCPKYLLAKWKREAQRCIPDVQVLVAEHLNDLSGRDTRDYLAWRQTAAGKSALTRRSQSVRRRGSRLQDSNCTLEDAELILTDYHSISLLGRRSPAAVAKPYTELVGPYTARRRRLVRGPDEKPIFALTCPDCGAVIRPDQASNRRFPTGKQLVEDWLVCTAIKTRLVADEDRPTVYKSRGRDAQGNPIQVGYRSETLRDKRGLPKTCGARLWQYTGDPIDKVLPEHAPDIFKTFGEPRRYELGVPGYYQQSSVLKPTPVERVGPRKWDLDRYLRQHLPYRLDAVIIDEVHQARSRDAARGMAAGNLAGVAKDAVIALTGTLSGGYASTLFYVLWRFSRAIREAFGYDDVQKWVDQFGIRETQFRERASGQTWQRVSGSPIKRVERPGLAPSAYRYLWESTLFAELPEIFSDLPDYNDEVIYCQLEGGDDPNARTTWEVPRLRPDGSVQTNLFGQAVTDRLELTQAGAYQWLLRRIGETLKGQGTTRGSRTEQAQAIMALWRFPNAPGVPLTLRRGESTLIDVPGLRDDRLYPKERALVDYVQAGIAQGRKALVYVTHVGVVDVAARVQRVLAGYQTQDGRPIRAVILRSDSPPAIDREQWLADQVTAGVDVVICNPELIQMGLDLIAFPDIYVYEIDYNPYTLAQAVRRSLRYGQDRDVWVRYLCYEGTVEVNAVRLMAQKLLTAAMISGSEIGEAFMQQGGQQDIFTTIANQIREGYLGPSREELQATFNQAKEAEQQRERELQALQGLATGAGLAEALAQLTTATQPIPEAVAPPADTPQTEGFVGVLLPDGTIGTMEEAMQRLLEGASTESVVPVPPDVTEEEVEDFAALAAEYERLVGGQP